MTIAAATRIHRARTAGVKTLPACRLHETVGLRLDSSQLPMPTDPVPALYTFASPDQVPPCIAGGGNAGRSSC